MEAGAVAVAQNSAFVQRGKKRVKELLCLPRQRFTNKRNLYHRWTVFIDPVFPIAQSFFYFVGDRCLSPGLPFFASQLLCPFTKKYLHVHAPPHRCVDALVAVAAQCRQIARGKHIFNCCQMYMMYFNRRMFAANFANWLCQQHRPAAILPPLTAAQFADF